MRAGTLTLRRRGADAGLLPLLGGGGLRARQAPQPSFDKQYVRDWASASGWDAASPAPEIPDEVVAGTRERYGEAYELIVGEPL